MDLGLHIKFSQKDIGFLILPVVYTVRLVF